MKKNLIILILILFIVSALSILENFHEGDHEEEEEPEPEYAHPVIFTEEPLNDNEIAGIVANTGTEGEVKDIEEKVAN